MDNAELLRSYSENGAEEAFTELVRRHANLVYSAARRQVLDPQLAEEITQRTFLLMAEKAQPLCHHPALVGWLYRTACQVASQARRAEQRRRLREQKAISMDSPTSTSEVTWAELAPSLDEAMNQLSEKDRLAILGRFFEGKPMREVGLTLGIGEDAAKMRVARALERLRKFLARRGIVCSAGALAAVLSAHSVEAAPAGLVGSLAGLAAGIAPKAPVATSILTKSLLLMSATNLVKVGTALTVLLLASATFHHVRQGSGIDAAAQAAKSFKSRLGDRSAAAAAKTTAQTEADTADPAIAAALTNLRNALYQPPSSAHIPYDRIAPALAQFGDRKRLAVPLLLAALNDLNMNVHPLATRALTLLGPDAADATPELLRLLKANRMAVQNEELVSLFAAVHPNPDIIPELLPLLGQTEIFDRTQVARLIGALAQVAPEQAESFRAPLTELLSSDDADTRFYAAVTFSGFPGEKPAAAVAELGKGLKLARLQDPHAYDPVFNAAQNTTYMRDGEKLFDNTRRMQAVGALPLMGAEAKQFLPDLEAVAQLTDDPQLRKSVLFTIGKLDPERRNSDPELARLLASAEAGQQLAAKARSGGASMEDLVSGLNYEESAHVAAEALYNRGEEARAALPAMEQAVRKWGAYDAARALARFAPEKLVGIVTEGSSINAVAIAAQVMAETPSAFAGTAAQLQQALEKLDPEEIGARHGLAAAIAAIDPQAPKPLFGWDDLRPAVQALDRAAEAAGPEVHKQVTDLQIRMFQDLNQKTHAEVLAFLAALGQVNGSVHDAFAAKLVELNPSLRGALGSR